MDCQELSRTVMDSLGLSWTVMDCQGLSRTVRDCQELSRTVMDCHIGYILPTLVPVKLLLQLKMAKYSIDVSNS